MTFTAEEVVTIVRGLDGPCWSCFGGLANPPSMSDESGTCAICDGSGYTLTEAGEALLEFLGRHGKELKQ